MPTTAPLVLPLPQPDVPLIDPTSGKPTQAFYEWAARLTAVLKQVRSEIP